MNKNKIILSIIGILLISFSFLKLYPNLIKPKVEITTTQTLPNREYCKYGVFDYNYELYIVKTGDTITSIAKNELADRNRIGEIILLNIGKYPSLGSQLSYLEKGWEFRLPPKNKIIKDPNQLQIFSGHIHENASKYFRVSADPNLSNTYIYDYPSSIYFIESERVNKQDIKTGVCFEAVIENDNQLTNTIVSLKTKN
ncbi:hypothetical protein HY612_02805 [Candidatus Roizmanbacteria bacterium]|nr:hypothetical protein [Candidatus Roizmanbacteria bacterium]